MNDSKRKVLIIGATGLIGSAVAARLHRDGHHVRGLARTHRRLDGMELVSFDMARATRPEDWTSVLAEVDLVINCAGALQDGPGDNVAAVHFDGPRALFEACEMSAVKRIIHFSAIGVERARPSDFSKTKNQADEALRASALDWVILRPSVVIGRAAYGASAMFRGLAALPILPLMPDTGRLQVVDLDDVVETVGEMTAARLRDLTLGVYERAEGIARERGIILADTKFELGARPDGTIVLADEVLTPDSSRFWPAAEWEPGRTQSSYDKQIVRNWLLSPESGWDRNGDAPPPALPDEVVERTRSRYVEAFELLTGERF